VHTVNRIKVTQYDKNNQIVKLHESIKDAETFSKVAKSSISKCCKGTLKTAGKFIWKYAK
tara:strand:+ start:367 stop:546 length:180 start_codon:yes stop_codon:yes gene_type:complete